MGNIWFISDTHFGHANILKFVDDDKRLIRPGWVYNGITHPFGNVQVMDELIIRLWNERVQPGDKVYHLGDFGYPLDICARLNGKKRLILGNHDKHQPGQLAKYFEKVSVTRYFGDRDPPFVLSHYPLHIGADQHKTQPRFFCVHGHIHERIIMAGARPDLRYMNIAVEQINYAPIHIDDVCGELRRRARLLFHREDGAHHA